MFARTVFSAVRIVQCCNEVELFCAMCTDHAERGSHCSESEQSGTILFSMQGLRSARFALFSVVTKWNYLVPCARTTLSAVRIVLSPNKVELSCSIRTGCAERGSHCSVSEHSGTTLLCSHRMRSGRFALFRVVTKWNYLVQCARTTFSAVRMIKCGNEVELSGAVRTDRAERGSHCSEYEQSGTILFSAHGLR